MKRSLSAILGAGLLAAMLTAAPQDEKAAKGKGDADKGKETFEQCGVCHNTDTDEKKMGPSLKGVYKKAKLNNGKKPSDATIKAIINAGGNGMPAYADMLSEEEKDNLLAYLKTL